LAQYLEELGHDVLLTREPGGTSIGDQIRSVLHDLHNTEMTGHTEFLLYSASRAQLVRQVILPHLWHGGIVVSDRFADSSIAYQGYGRQLDLQWVYQITRFATDGLTPDLTVYLDLSVEVGIQRKQAAFAAQHGECNRLDRQTIGFYQRVRAGYLELARTEPHRWLVIDAMQTIENIRGAIWVRLESVLPEVREVRKR
jgi:dTMP kinase